MLDYSSARLTKVYFILIVFLIISFNYKNISAQNIYSNFEFNEASINGWTITGPFSENNEGPFPSNFSQLLWTDSVNASNSSIYDSPNNGLGSLAFSTSNGHGIDGMESNFWIMRLRSPDLSISPQWFSARGFDVMIAQNMNADTNLWVDLSILVLDKDTERVITFTKPGRHRIVPGFWNGIRFFEWYNSPGFPQNYSVIALQIDVLGILDDNYQGSFYLDDLIHIPGRNIKVDYPFEVINETYEMISFPYYIFGNYDFVFSDDFGLNSPRNWRIFRWESLNENYLEYSAGNILAKPGVGFWFIKNGGGSFDIDYAQSVSTGEPYIIILEPGWNQIGNPFPFPVSWGNIISSSPIGINNINKWNSSAEEYEPGQSVLEPWVGYFIDNQTSESDTLKILPIEDENIQKPFFDNADKSKGEFVLQLKLENSKTRKVDSQNYIGMINKKGNINDEFNFREAPSPIDKINLSIIKNEIRYSGNFVAVNNEGSYWDLEISNSNGNEKGILTFENIDNLPEDFNVWLLNEDNKKSVRIAGNRAVIENSSFNNYRLIIGTKTFAENNNREINLEPIDYYLLQNYPNPFNPTTTINYSIADDGNVKLIIYDLLGKEIVRLVNDEEKSAGTYSVIWNGKNKFGNEVSSGLYFYKIITDKFSQTNKMVYLK